MSDQKTPEQVIKQAIRDRYDMCPPGKYPTEGSLTDFIVEALRANGIELVQTSKVTRVTVVAPDHGVAFERYGLYAGGVTLMTQDDDRTLKVFPYTTTEVES